MSAAHQKVTTSHLSRDAYLYVRQSSLRQVIDHGESTRRQYALRERAVALGWPTESIVVIDSDLGLSGADADREGFQRLVAEVGMGRAGIVLGLEVSRLARNSTDWHRLLEICALSETLILDEDGVYDPGDFNDRLLLGLKGTMSEAGLHMMRARLRGGLLAKARRGELKLPLPVGLVYDPLGQVVLDPDEQVRHSLRLLFDTFTRTGSASATVRHFNDEKLLLPYRPQGGPHKGELHWKPLRFSRVRGILHNPRYAGAFVYGRSRGRRRSGGVIDRTVGALLVELMTPLTLDVALQVQDELAARAGEADPWRAQRVQRASEEADLARQRFMQTRPENRMVADVLEAEWNAKLRALDEAQRELERGSAEADQGLDEEQRQRILALASDFPRLWDDPATPHRERKRMAWLLIEDVTLTKATRSLGVRLRGGATRQIAWTPDPHPSQLIKTSDEVVAEVDKLMNDHTDGEIAAILNQRGYRTGHGHAFDPISVKVVRDNYALKSRHDRLRERGLLTALEIADRFGVSDTTVYRWHSAGPLRAHAYSDRPRYLYEILDPPPTEQPGPSPKQGRCPDLADQRSIEVQYGT